ncbi:Uncharacterized protein TCM_044760 [Theobroma cacao]|uniref:Sulfotransferase n=1 Tax=Theobroma cacao TaxID=3641 RepID=A0A061FQP2_THECC|nr:Uncharacterized protein TCM_044760 [Theobroma cacao]
MEGEQSHENHPPSSIVEGDDDVIVASKPKAGTIWLKALAFSIVNRTRYWLSNNLLNSAISYNFVPFVEITLYGQDQIPDLTSIPPPRLFATHLSYSVLPESMKQGNSQIVYVTPRQQQHPFAAPHPRLLVNLPKRPPPEAKEVFKTKPAPHYKALSITTATGSTVQPPIKGNPTAPKEEKPPAATKTTSEAIPNKRSQPKKQP